MARVLIVDDTAVDRRRAGGLLEESGQYEIVYAQNGKEALDEIARLVPEMVVTDLQMPELDGLELVTQVRAHYPNVPVVLMTAVGSDAVAIEALERGAASYVPKSQLNERLRETVEDVLGMVRADRSYEILARCQQRAVFQYDLENDPELIDILVEMIQQVVGSMQLTDQTGCYRIGVALREALHNALFHGNLQLTPDDVERSREQLLLGGADAVAERRTQPPYCDRRIRFEAEITREQAQVRDPDEGPGFDYVQMLATIHPRQTGTLATDRGRGFVLMLSFMDEVSFNESGNQVTMTKHKDPVGQGG